MKIQNECIAGIVNIVTLLLQPAARGRCDVTFHSINVMRLPGAFFLFLFQSNQLNSTYSSFKPSYF